MLQMNQRIKNLRRPVFDTYETHQQIDSDRRSNGEQRFYTPLPPKMPFKKSRILFQPIIEKLTQSGTILLAGHHASRNEKNELARFLAHLFHKVFDGHLAIREWKNATNIYDIPIFLMEGNRAIYILTDISPRMVQYNIQPVLDVVNQKSHILIITSSAAADAWSAIPATANIFYQPSTDSLFDVDQLALQFIESFLKAKSHFTTTPWKEFVNSCDQQKKNAKELTELIRFPLSTKYTVHRVAERLQGYENVEAFVRLAIEEYSPHQLPQDPRSGKSLQSENQLDFGVPDASPDLLNVDNQSIDFDVRMGTVVDSVSPNTQAEQNRSAEVTESNEQKYLTDDILEEMLDTVLSMDRDFGKWFSGLDPQSKYFLVGITLLSGLYENQLFAALEELVENDWRIREPMLAAFDYEQLKILMDYAVVVIRTGEIENKITVRRKLLKHVFEECWRNEQRLIINSIQGLLNLVKNITRLQGSQSYDNPVFDISEQDIEKLIQLKVPAYIIRHLRPIVSEKFSRSNDLINRIKGEIGNQSFRLFEKELNVVFDFDGRFIDDDEFREIFRTSKKSQLYGSADKQALLRQVIGSTIRTIAYQSLPIAEQALFYFASTEITEMHILAAKSLAQWKKKENDLQKNAKYEQQLLAILRRWHKSPEQVFDYFGVGVSSDKKAIIEEGRVFVHATIVAAIGYASSYDIPNKCCSKLLDMLRSFFPATNEKIANYLNGITVPILIKFHLKQLHENRFLYNLMENVDSAKCIAFELSLTYLKNPELFKDIVSSIYEGCDEHEMQHQYNQHALQRVERQRKTILTQQRLKAVWPDLLRRRLLAVLIATYGLIRFMKGRERPSAEEILLELAVIYDAENKQPEIIEAVLDAIREQIKLQFYEIAREIRSTLPLLEFKDVVLLLPGFIPRYKKERLLIESQLKRDRDDYIESLEIDIPFDDSKFDSERYATGIEDVIFDWIFDINAKVCRIGYLIAFYLKHNADFNESSGPALRFTVSKKVEFRWVKQILIPPLCFSIPLLCFCNFGQMVLVYRLLPLAIRLEDSYYFSRKRMLKTWHHKLKRPRYRELGKLGRALSGALWFANHLWLVLLIYFLLVVGLLVVMSRELQLFLGIEL